ncbi:MAG: peptidase M50 [uncultured bacterium]|nr:MAG: peptidase M50 [uncultured bacterium]
MGFDLYFIIALIFAITIHEFSHAAVANYLGDPTARYQGRLTLNPIAHLDFMGTMMLFLIGFGWGKPVPVNSHNLYHPKRDSAFVSLAGPGSNILMAIAISLPYKYISLNGGSPQWAEFLATLFDFNLILAIFNFIPLPPLDGSKMIGIFIPRRYEDHYERFLEGGVKYFIGFILIDSVVLQSVFGFSILSFVIGNAYLILKSIILIGT